MKQAQYANHQGQWRASWRLRWVLNVSEWRVGIIYKYVYQGNVFPHFLSLCLCSKHMCTGVRLRTHTDMQIDCCTEKSIGDFIDESLTSSPKQNKLFTSQLESNGVMTVVSTFSNDKWAFPCLRGSLTQIHSYFNDPGRPLRRKKPHSQMFNEACLDHYYCTLSF